MKLQFQSIFLGGALVYIIWSFQNQYVLLCYNKSNTFGKWRYGAWTSLAVQELRLQAASARGTDLIPGWGAIIKIPHACSAAKRCFLKKYKAEL